MKAVAMPTVSRVAVCGGTHGNELAGIYLVREMLKKRADGTEPVSVVTVMSNPRAAQLCVRYVETDLNRCFTRAALSAPVSETSPYEMVRSQELNALLGPKASMQAVDLLCDLHNTTANTGLCLITYSDRDWICLHICKHLKHVQFPYMLDICYAKAYLCPTSVSISMEIGPQPHGVVRSVIFSAMQEGVQLMMDWICQFNSGTLFEGGWVDVYTMVKNIDYPRDSETHVITAAVHPDLQDRDFCLLHPGDPMFLCFSGETLRYRGKEALYPFFINEGAYYEKGVALSLARKRRVQIPSQHALGLLDY
uniref:N-acyl-aromatic-L-amino acid amidohydrolase n=1 Tax=Sinocyclocheilus rhinocerous TaxID=307959 RepID=A0A673JWX5_9TELE